MTEAGWRQPRTLADFALLRPAETRLLDGRDSGLRVVIGPKVPEADAPPEVRIRASFLRWLILGAEGAEGRLHETGVRVVGAFIESDGPEGAATRGLDLSGCAVDWDVALFGCRFEDRPWFDDARLGGLYLDGSRTPGLDADRLETRGGVHLRNGFESDGAIRLVGARIGGDLAFVGAKLRNAGGNALSADGLTTAGDVFLRDGFVCDGAIRLLGARIGGNLSCVGATLRNEDGTALQVDGARIDGGFFLREGASVAGRIDLSAAEIGHLNDDPACWPVGRGAVVLDRCVYGAFTGMGVDAATRIGWLDRQDPALFGQDFWPQPWEHCARVLREMGHADDARAVLIAKEKRQRVARRARASSWRRPWLWMSDRLMGATVRYGRAPLFAGWWLLGLWLLGVAVFGGAAATDAIKPNQPMVLRSPEWVLCGIDAGARVFVPSLQGIATGRRAPGQSQLACWREAPEAAQYPRFDALVYSADALLPVVSLEMQGFWLPDESAGPVGAFARVWLWVHIGAGWALTLLAVAGFSGIVKSD